MVDWPNWLFFGTLEGSNGWAPLVDVRLQEDGGYDSKVPLTKDVANQFPSRRCVLWFSVQHAQSKEKELFIEEH